MLTVMRVADEVVQARREKLALLLAKHQYLPLTDLCERLHISPATARRDLAALAAHRTITRTYGGALVEYNQRFRSFAERREHQAEAKRRMAALAITLIRPGTTCYLDGGSSIYALAQLIAAGGTRPLTVVTINLPAAELLAQSDEVEVNLLSGQYLPRQSILLGPKTPAAARLWRYDLAFFGAEAMDAQGCWNTQTDVIAVERAVAKSAKASHFLIDGGKLGASAPEFLLSWQDIDHLISDASPERISQAGIVLKRDQLLQA
jgi:DeoR/GlpR family transcriptional regulator of sugar metabolism